MAPPKQGARKKAPSKPTPRTRQPSKPERKPNNPSKDQDADANELDLVSSIPVSLQQLLLDVFKSALLTPHTPSNPSDDHSDALDTKSLIQTIKSHLYQRDFDSAFTDASEDLLRAYALRWSAARALGYAGLFKGVLGWMRGSGEHDTRVNTSTRVVCIGGGAGAEIVALAAAWRDLDSGLEALEKGVAGASLQDETAESGSGSQGVAAATDNESRSRLSVAAVDIADWSSVVDRLSATLVSPDVPTPSSSRHKPPLVPSTSRVDVAFSRADVLTLPEPELKDILLETGSSQASASSGAPVSLLVTLMFTLNELFSTSMSKATGLLLRMTDILPPGAALLVVDSPGSYSTLKLGQGKEGAAQERKYPMKFLLDHTLLSVTEGKWQRVHTQDSRWWRRDASRLRYDVGEGAGLEDMRFQVHLYQRV